MHGPIEKSMGASSNYAKGLGLPNKTWYTYTDRRNERPRNSLSSFTKKLSGINMHEETLGIKIQKQEKRRNVFNS